MRPPKLEGPDRNKVLPVDDLPHRYEETLARIASAVQRYRPAADQSSPVLPVRLLAISKGHPAAAVRRLATLGQREFGENYLQEAGPKMAELGDLNLTWHFTGQIQANKTRPIAERFHWVHTLDRERIASRLNEQRSAAAPINVCIQVRLEDEPGKGGVAPDELADLATRIRDFPGLKLRGLMCIPPPRDSFEARKALFDRVAHCLRGLNAQGFNLDTLSMGMSADLDAAIAAGATMVRIGTALFGPRTYPPK